MKLSWGYGIGAAYIIFAGSMILFVVIATRQKYDLVSNDYYDQAVHYQQKIDGKHNASLPGSNLAISFSQSENVIRITTPGDRQTVNGMLFLYKPDDQAKDFSIPFRLREESACNIPVKHLSPGAWRVKASWQNNGLDCYSETSIFIK
jgi:hypothetical protein